MAQKRSEQRRKQNKKKVQTRRALLAIIVVLLVCALAAGAVFGISFLKKHKKYDTYTVTSTTEVGGAMDNLSYHTYGNGFLQLSSSGLVYFDRDMIFWDEQFEMSHPIIDICGDYVAVADLKQNDIYIYDKSGLRNRISSTHSIIDLEISSLGTVAISTNDKECNYIELKDINGSDLINVKSVFSSSGYLQDITLSEDGQKLVASFIYISQGALESKILFYDFAGKNTENMLVGAFNQYDDTVITDVAFMSNGNVCAVGDNALSFYSFGQTPALISEQLKLDWEIQSLSIGPDKLLLVVKDDNSDYNYRAHVYGENGKELANVGFNFAFNKAQLAGKNILLSSATDCMMISFDGIKRFSGTFGDRISYLLPLKKQDQMLLATSENVKFIKLK